MAGLGRLIEATALWPTDEDGYRSQLAAVFVSSPDRLFDLLEFRFASSGYPGGLWLRSCVITGKRYNQ
jgi:hypothetical protein